MADANNIVKLPTPPNASNKSLVPVKPNISALARQHGVSRQTIRRRLANGWQPPASSPVEIIEPTQSMATYGHPHDRPVQRYRSYSRAMGRIATGLVIGVGLHRPHQLSVGAGIPATASRRSAWQRTLRLPAHQSRIPRSRCHRGAGRRGLTTTCTVPVNARYNVSEEGIAMKSILTCAAMALPITTAGAAPVSTVVAITGKDIHAVACSWCTHLHRRLRLERY
jgi:hypothetical protein